MDTPEKIYLDLNFTPKNIKELIKSVYFYTSDYGEIDSIKSFDLIIKNKNSCIFRSNYSYLDKDCTILNCKQGKYRSFDDIEIIINTYFPNTSKEDILHNIIKLDKELVPIFHNCTDIGKPTLYYTGTRYTNCPSIPSYYEMKNSEYTWQELFELINITDSVSLKDYFNE